MSSTSTFKYRSYVSLKGHLTRQLTKCDQYCQGTLTTPQQLESYIKTAQRKLQQVEEAAAQYIQSLEEEKISAERHEAVLAETAKYEDNVQDRLDTLLNILTQMSTPPTTSTSISLGDPPKPRLPTINLPTFAGREGESWHEFWEQFTALVDSQANLSKATRFNYLKGQLQGEALSVITNLSITEDNYEVAINLLKENYDDAELLVNNLLSKLLDLTPPIDNPESLQSFRLEVNSIITALSIHKDTTNAEWVLQRIVQRKLPNNVLMLICTQRQNRFLTLKDISEGLKARIDLMRTFGTKETQGDSKQKSHDRPNHQLKEPQYDEFGTYMVTKTTTTHRKEKPANNTLRNRPCLFCRQSHRMYNCPTYPDRVSRIGQLKHLGRCTRCLRVHESKGCQTPLNTCFKCEEGIHHTALCGKVTLNTEAPKVSMHSGTIVGYCGVKGSTTSMLAETMTASALPTAMLTVNSKGTKYRTRGLFDEGSQRTFITTKLMTKLTLKPVTQITLSIRGFLSNSGPQKLPVVKLYVRLGGYVRPVYAIAVDQFPSELHVENLGTTVKHLKASGMKLADPDIASDHIKDIEMLIGADYYHKYILGKSKKQGMNLLHSAGGKLLTGPVLFQAGPLSRTIQTQPIFVARLGIDQSPVEIQQRIDEGIEPVHKLWDLDTIGIKPSQATPDEQYAYKQYLETVQYKDGQYWVRLPWRLNHPPLPTNYHMAYGQFRSQVTKLSKHPEHFQIYTNIIQEQLEKGFIEIIENDDPTNGHYLPHHAVAKDSVTTPLRIVFNCSAKVNGKATCLNDCLQTGPSLTQKLHDILLKFRTNSFAYTADISKAFLRVGLQPEDRPFTKFLWLKDPADINGPTITYRFASVLFGATSSPFLLQATLDTHLAKSKSPLKEEISQNLYVDNFQGTTNSSTKLFELYKDANRELKEANMPLQSWASNCQSLNKRIMSDFPGYQVTEEQKILGIGWNLKSDELKVKAVPVRHQVVTKRDLLSQISKCFDPLGLLSPITIRGRILVQESWQTKVGWDQPLPHNFQEAWREMAGEQAQLETITFPRKTAKEGIATELHVFCDASIKAYGAVAYLVTQHKVAILTSKARVAPLKRRTLPQMELTALLIGTRLATHVKKVLSTLTITAVVIWSDNEAVLQWVRNENSKTPYVSNRVAEIKELSSECPCQFLYVPTKDNPADYLSRGLTIKQFKRASLWFTGPRWLAEGKRPEQKSQVIVDLIHTVIPPKKDPVIDCTRFSTLKKLIRVTQYVFSFLCKRGIKYKFPTVLNYWISQAQRDTYGEEYQQLPDKMTKDLGLWIDGDANMVRCGGRLKHADLDLEAKHPWLLPKDHWVTKLIILDTHQFVTNHGGPLDTLTQLRQHYWIPHGRQTVKKVVKDCVICRRYDARVCPYPGPPPLPRERVVLLRPFETSGVDFTGAITLTGTTDKIPIKAYICLFTCATTRGIHLEVTPDMSAESFIQAFRRFAARRSCPKLMISDNGSNLVAGEACLREIGEHRIVRNALEQRHCRWKFIPPRAPWHGGFYERMVGTIKRCLRKTLHRQKINFMELQTVVTEIESRVNNRPLTYLTDDPTQHQPLSPAHLMYGRPLTPISSFPDPEMVDPSYVRDSDLVTSYKKLSNIIQQWEDIWRREYLTSLREHHYGASPPHNKIDIQPGDVVLVDCDGPRSDWPLGRVVSIHPDSRGVLRIVKVTSRGVTSLKTLEKLIKLESVGRSNSRGNVVPTADQDKPEDMSGEVPERHKRPEREAAQKCLQNIQRYYQSSE